MSQHGSVPRGGRRRPVWAVCARRRRGNGPVQARKRVCDAPGRRRHGGRRRGLGGVVVGSRRWRRGRRAGTGPGRRFVAENERSASLGLDRSSHPVGRRTFSIRFSFGCIAPSKTASALEYGSRVHLVTSWLRGVTRPCSRRPSVHPLFGPCLPAECIGDGGPFERRRAWGAHQSVRARCRSRVARGHLPAAPRRARGDAFAMGGLRQAGRAAQRAAAPHGGRGVWESGPVAVAAAHRDPAICRAPALAQGGSGALPRPQSRSPCGASIWGVAGGETSEATLSPT